MAIQVNVSKSVFTKSCLFDCRNHQKNCQLGNITLTQCTTQKSFGNCACTFPPCVITTPVATFLLGQLQQ